MIFPADLPEAGEMQYGIPGQEAYAYEEKIVQANKCLLAACDSGEPSLENLEAALEAGADVHCRDEDGWAPLHLAAYHEHQALVERLLRVPGILLELTVPPDLDNDDPSMNAWALAEKYGKDKKIKDMLFKAMQEKPSRPLGASWWGRWKASVVCGFVLLVVGWGLGVEHLGQGTPAQKAAPASSPAKAGGEGFVSEDADADADEDEDEDEGPVS